jgi:uncharacterized protein (DUF2267 family)
MAENTHSSDEVEAGAVSFDRESGNVPRLIERLKAHPRFQEVGLTKDPGEVLLAVLCSLWRDLSLQQFDVLRGVLPADLDLLVAECTLPHGRRKRPETFVMGAFLDDLSEHLAISRAHAPTVASVVLSLLAELIPEEVSIDIDMRLPDDLRNLLRRPS